MTDFGTSTNFLESVNICLTALGERSVTTLSSIQTYGRNTVVDLAVRVLDEVNKDVEARGWWFQSSRGQIIGLGSGTVGAWNASHPEEFRRYVTIRAARILQTRYITDETLHKLTSEEEMYSKAVLEAKDAEEDSSVTFALPQEIENLGVRGVMFLQSNLEEKLGTLKLGRELAETELIQSQKTKLDAETAYMVTAEKSFYENGGYSWIGVVGHKTYKDYRPEFRIMGIQEAAFQALPAYKKGELLKDADQLRTDRATSDTDAEIISSVNKILRYIGVSKVSSNTNEHALASEARDLLVDTDLELQSRGWWFNTEKDVTFTITSSKIVVDTTTQLYEELDDYDTTRVLDGSDIVLKNLKDNTIDEFSGTIKGTRIVKRSITTQEVPQKYRDFLEVKVALTLSELYTESIAEVQSLRKKEAELETYFKDRENDQGNYNIFDNYDTNERIGFNRNYDLN
jgi:hypothetical protein